MAAVFEMAELTGIEKCAEQQPSTSGFSEVELGECLICLNRGLADVDSSEGIVKKNEEIFDTILDILNVNLSPFSWDFRKEAFPFCSACSTSIRRLIWTHERLAVIQNEMVRASEDIMTKLKESELEKTSIPADVRIVIFRGQILKNSPTVSVQDLQTKPANKRWFISSAASPVTPSGNVKVVSSEPSLPLPIHSSGSVISVGGCPKIPNIEMKTRKTRTRKTKTVPLSTSSSISLPNSTGHDHHDSHQQASQAQGSDQLRQMEEMSALPDDIVSLNSIITTAPKDFQDLMELEGNKNDNCITVIEDLDDQINVAANETVVFQDDTFLQAEAADKIEENDGGEGDNTEDCDNYDSNCDDAPAPKKKRKSKKTRKFESKSSAESPNFDVGKFDSEREPEEESDANLQMHRNRHKKDGKSRNKKTKKRPNRRYLHFCTVCDLKCLTAKILAEHKITHLKREELPYECSFCGKRHATKTAVIRHEARIHLCKQGDSKENYKFPCKFCGQRFTKYKSTRDHMHRSHREAYLSGKVISSPTPKRVPELTCLVCDKKLLSRKHLTEHKLTHLKIEELPCECSFCGKRHATERSVLRHEKRIHLCKEGDSKENYKFPCEFCGQRFTKYKTTRDHMHRSHREEYLHFAKDIADRRLKRIIVPDVEAEENDPDCLADADDTEESGTFPMSTVDGTLSYRKINFTPIDNGYTCGKCGRTITHSKDRDRAMRDHINGHHYGKYQCPTCQTYCKSEYALRRHERECHNVKACKICGRPELKLKNFELHLWTHKSQEEKQKLIDANEYWKTPRHIRKKFGMKVKGAWCCRLCDEIVVFTTRSDLNNHQENVHRKRQPNKTERNFITDTESETDEDCDDMSSSESDSDRDSESECQNEWYDELEREDEKTTKTSDIKAEERASENIPVSSSSMSVSLSRLPDSLLDGRDFLFTHDNLISFTTSGGMRKTVNVPPFPKQTRRRTHFKIELSSSDEDSFGDGDRYMTTD